MFDPARSIRRHVLGMPGYEPILPFEVLSRELGIPERDLVKLDANENLYAPLPEVLQALAELRHSNIYPDPESRLLREAISRHHGLPMENLMAGAGADELIDLVMRLFLEPGDAVLNCPPTFGIYAFDTGVNAGRLFNVQRNPDFTLNIEAIELAVKRQHPKLMLVASPNNPDGSLLSSETIERLLGLPLMVVVDEAYLEFAPAGSSFLSEVLNRNNLIVLRTFSKWAGLAGMRVGYGVFPSELMPHLWKIKQPYNVSVAAAVAARVSLQCSGKLNEIARRIIDERERLYGALKQISWLHPYRSNANFILCRVLDREAIDVKAKLRSSGILVRYFNQPRLRDHIRISVGKPEHTDALIAKLKEMG